MPPLLGRLGPETPTVKLSEMRPNVRKQLRQIGTLLFTEPAFQIIRRIRFSEQPAFNVLPRGHNRGMNHKTPRTLVDMRSFVGIIQHAVIAEFASELV